MELLCVLGLFSAASRSATVTLGWDRSTTTNVTYKLYQAAPTANFSPVQYGLTTNIATVTGVSTNIPTLWYVTAVAANGLESTPSNTVTNVPVFVPTPTNTPPVDPPMAPESPWILYVNRVTGSRLDVGWATKDLSSVSQVWRMSSMESTFRLVATLPAGTLHWSDNNAQQKKDFSYRVVSCSNYGCSQPSATVTYPAK